MVSDNEGFLRPEIDFDLCDNCFACKLICPILHPPQPDCTKLPKVYACWSRDHAVRFQSASGGAFSSFAGHVLDGGGVVFGAAFYDGLKVKHIIVHNKKELTRLRSSKYVQSDIGCAYKEVRSLLRQNRMVLFSGTPCQIVALKAFLGNYCDENIITCDLICRGVPSPGLFAKYVSNIERRFQAKLTNINFRHKCISWELMSTMAVFDDNREVRLTGYKNSFMYGFLNGFTIRTACYRCPYRSVNRFGDITLADFWGIGESVPFQNDTHNGVSLVFVNSEKGYRLFEESSEQLNFEERTLEEAKKGQSLLTQPLFEPKNRRQFFADYQRLDYEALAKRHLVNKGMKGLIKRFVPRTWIFHIRKYLRKYR